MRLPRTPRGNSRYNGWILCRRPRIDTRCCSSYSFRVVEEVLHLLKKKPAWFHHRKKISKYPSFSTALVVDIVLVLVIFIIIVIAMRQRRHHLVILRRSECGWIFRDKISRKNSATTRRRKKWTTRQARRSTTTLGACISSSSSMGEVEEGAEASLVTVSKEKMLVISEDWSIIQHEGNI